MSFFLSKIEFFKLFFLQCSQKEKLIVNYCKPQEVFFLNSILCNEYPCITQKQLYIICIYVNRKQSRNSELRCNLYKEI